MNKQSNIDEYATIEAMLESLKDIFSRLRKKEEDNIKPLSIKKLLEQKQTIRSVSRLRTNIYKKTKR